MNKRRAGAADILPAEVFGRTAIDLLKGTHKELIVCHTVELKNVANREIRVFQILAYMGQSDAVQIRDKGRSHITAEKTTEILGI